jgi:hypothetical protein
MEGGSRKLDPKTERAHLSSADVVAVIAMEAPTTSPQSCLEGESFVTGEILHVDGGQSAGH